MAETVSLELLFARINEVLDSQRRIEERLERIEEDMLVLQTMTRRIEARSEARAVQLSRGLEGVEARLHKLEEHADAE